MKEYMACREKYTLSSDPPLSLSRRHSITIYLMPEHPGQGRYLHWLPPLCPTQARAGRKLSMESFPLQALNESSLSLVHDTHRAAATTG